jgi:hypothetical protein
MAPELVWDLERVHGLSIFLPLGEDLELVSLSPSALDRNPRLRETYTSEQLLFAGETYWAALIDRYYQTAGNVPGAATQGPLEGLIPPDVTPPQSSISVSSPQYPGQEVTIAWSAEDRQSGVASASLWVRPPGGEWAAAGPAQAGPPGASLSGLFVYPASAACGAAFAVRAVDAAGNVEPPDQETNTAGILRPCFIFLPWAQRY